MNYILNHPLALEILWLALWLENESLTSYLITCHHPQQNLYYIIFFLSAYALILSVKGFYNQENRKIMVNQANQSKLIGYCKSKIQARSY